LETYRDRFPAARYDLMKSYVDAQKDKLDLRKIFLGYSDI